MKDWKDRALSATNGTQFGAILAAALGREIPPPCFHGKATVTCDGFMICDFTASDGTRHMGAFAGAWEDLETNFQGLSRHLSLTDDERKALARTLERWTGNYHRLVVDHEEVKARLLNKGRYLMDFDPAKTARLRKAYNAAVAKGVEQFTFDGHELLVAYAKYMLEYLDGLAKKRATMRQVRLRAKD